MTRASKTRHWKLGRADKIESDRERGTELSAPREMALGLAAEYVTRAYDYDEDNVDRKETASTR